MFACFLFFLPASGTPHYAYYTTRGRVNQTEKGAERTGKDRERTGKGRSAT